MIILSGHKGIKKQRHFDAAKLLLFCGVHKYLKLAFFINCAMKKALCDAFLLRMSKKSSKFAPEYVIALKLC